VTPQPTTGRTPVSDIVATPAYLWRSATGETSACSTPWVGHSGPCVIVEGIDVDGLRELVHRANAHDREPAQERP